MPGRRSAKSGLPYQSVYQGAAGSPATACATFWGLSPSVVPAGPNAATLATVRTCGGGVVAGAVVAGAVVAGAVMAGAVVAGAAAVGDAAAVPARTVWVCPRG